MEKITVSNLVVHHQQILINKKHAKCKIIVSSLSVFIFTASAVTPSVIRVTVNCN